jgi:AhpD family alkylhydroperoxidase
MNTIQVYDPPMCCSTGVCGSEVDPTLVRFAADLKWLGEQGVTVQRFNLTQTPIAFAENETVRAMLTEKGESALPLVLVDGKVVVTGTYPSREELVGLVGLSSGKPSLFSPAVGELVAIGAAIAANCEPCLRHHMREAEKLGVSVSDMALAVAMAAKVKDAPHQAVLRLAAKLTGPAEKPAARCASPAPEAAGKGGSCCG